MTATLDSSKVRCYPIFGHIELVQTMHPVEGGRGIAFGGYAIHYDENGVETHRTKDEPLSVLWFE